MVLMVPAATRENINGWSSLYYDDDDDDGK
jgi:hypothetical protein